MGSSTDSLRVCVFMYVCACVGVWVCKCDTRTKQLMSDNFCYSEVEAVILYVLSLLVFILLQIGSENIIFALITNRANSVTGHLTQDVFSIVILVSMLLP